MYWLIDWGICAQHLLPARFLLLPHYTATPREFIAFPKYRRTGDRPAYFCTGSSVVILSPIHCPDRNLLFSPVSPLGHGHSPRIQIAHSPKMRARWPPMIKLHERRKLLLLNIYLRNSYNTSIWGTWATLFPFQRIANKTQEFSGGNRTDDTADIKVQRTYPIRSDSSNTNRHCMAYSRLIVLFLPENWTIFLQWTKDFPQGFENHYDAAELII